MRCTSRYTRSGQADLTGLAGCWKDRYPDETARLGDRLAHLATGLLWKLEALGWVQVGDGTYSATADGRSALGAATCT